MDASVTLTRISLLFLSLLFTLSCHSQADLIGDTCKKTLFPDLCISTLRSNPSSAAADVKGLARIMFYATAVKATATLNQVNVLLKKTNDVVLIECLENCASEYASALNDIFTANKNVGSDIFAAKGVAADLIAEAQDCEGTFTDEPYKRKSPLTVENEVLRDLAATVIEIINTLGMDVSVTLTRMSLLFLSLLFTLSCHSQADLIGDTCKKTLHPDLCISALRSNPSSVAADVEGLARIVFYAIAVKATATLNQVNVLLKKTNDVVLIGALEN
ncbi:hypothetical protein C3L33_07692, partial [Rhododendron williamsianum]